MIEWTDELQKNYKSTLFIAFTLYVQAPLCYLLVTYFMKKELVIGGQFDIMFYILLFLGMILPTIIPLLEKSYISAFKKEPNNYAFRSKISINPFHRRKKEGTPIGLYSVLFLVQASIVESIFIFGFIVYLTSGDITRMLYFYPIGIAWSFVYFPTKSRCIKFLEKVSTDAIV